MDQDNKKVQVWNVNVGERPVRVATVEQGDRKPSMCDGCPAPCCKGMLRPVLTEQEFKERKFPTLFLEPPDWMKQKVPRAQAIVTLGGFNNSGCGYFDHTVGLCTVWPDCPKGCLSYDCREDSRPEIKEFADARKQAWPEP